jgi:hypothetical protein
VAVGTLFVVQGLVTLARRRAVPGGRTRDQPLRWKPWGLYQLCVGTGFLLGTAPRIAGLSSGWVLLIAIAAFGLVLLGVRYGMQARVRQSSSGPDDPHSAAPIAESPIR